MIPKNYILHVSDVPDFLILKNPIFNEEIQVAVDLSLYIMCAFFSNSNGQDRRGRRRGGGVSIIWKQVLQYRVFTSRKRSLGQGNVFTHVCQSFCSRGGDVYPACTGQGGALPRRWPARERGCPGTRGRHSPPGPETDPRDDHWSGQYASYWNTFLFFSETYGKIIKCTNPT